MREGEFKDAVNARGKRFCVSVRCKGACVCVCGGGDESGGEKC